MFLSPGEGGAQMKSAVFEDNQFVSQGTGRQDWEQRRRFLVHL